MGLFHAVEDHNGFTVMPYPGTDGPAFMWFNDKYKCENAANAMGIAFDMGVKSVSLDSMLVKQTQEALLWRKEWESISETARVLKIKSDSLQEKLKEAEDKVIETQLNMLTQGSRYINTASALKKAVEIIKIWHGEPAWDIYFNNSPEMKEIRDVVNQAKELLAKKS